MKKKILLSVALALFCGSFVFAQPKADGTPKAILKTDQQMSSPVWSPNGNKLAVTSFKNTGIWVVDVNGKNLQQLTNDLGAGYKMTWSADNSTILSKPFVIENNRRFFDVKTYNVEDKTEKVMVSKTRELKGMPYFSNDNSEVVYNVNDQSKKSATGLKTKATSTLKAESLYQTMILDPGNVTSKVAGLSQFAGKTLFNAALSPKGDKIAFQIAGKGLFVCNVDASEIKSIGNGETASWMPDGEYLIVSKPTDDGENVIESELYSVDVNTGTYSLLIKNELVAMRPNVSPNGKKIAFEDYSTGVIYVIDIKY